jgi:hypothetical protein
MPSLKNIVCGLSFAAVSALSAATACAQDAPWGLDPAAGHPFPFAAGQPMTITLSTDAKLGTLGTCCPPGRCYFKIETGETFGANGDPFSGSITAVNPPGAPPSRDYDYDLLFHMDCGFTLGGNFQYTSFMTADVHYYVAVSCTPSQQVRSSMQRRQAAVRKESPRQDQACECQAYSVCAGQWIQFPGGPPCCNHVVCPSGNCCVGAVQCG